MREEEGRVSSDLLDCSRPAYWAYLRDVSLEPGRAKTTTCRQVRRADSRSAFLVGFARSGRCCQPDGGERAKFSRIATYEERRGLRLHRPCCAGGAAHVHAHRGGFIVSYITAACDVPPRPRTAPAAIKLGMATASPRFSAPEFRAAADRNPLDVAGELAEALAIVDQCIARNVKPDDEFLDFVESLLCEVETMQVFRRIHAA